jgi:uncharacterized membrane protein YcaP (DUF421 family)
MAPDPKLRHRIFSILKSRFPRFGALIDGTPVVLSNKGEFKPDVMNKANIAPDDIMAVARGRGIKSFPGISYAVLERSGSLSIIKKRDDK